MVSFQPLTLVAKRSILDVWQVSKYAGGMLLELLVKIHLECFVV